MHTEHSKTVTTSLWIYLVHTFYNTTTHLSQQAEVLQTYLHHHVDGEADHTQVIDDHEALQVDSTLVLHVLGAEPHKEQVGDGQVPHVHRRVVQHEPAARPWVWWAKHWNNNN